MDARSGVLDHPLSLDNLFKLIWTGYFWGTGAFFFPIALVIGLTSLFTGSPENVFLILLVPLILAFQGVVFSGIILFGIGVYRKVVALRRS